MKEGEDEVKHSRNAGIFCSVRQYVVAIVFYLAEDAGSNPVC